MALPSILAALLNRFSSSRTPLNGAAVRENEPKSWLRRWFSQHRSPDLPAAAARRPLRPLGIARLEDRRVLSVSGSITGGVLSVTGDGDPDSVNVIVNGDDLQLEYDGGGAILINGSGDPVSIAGLTEIEFNLGDGDDVLNLPVIAGLTVAVVDDAAGDDTISLTGTDSITGTSFTGDAEQIELSGDLNFTAGFGLTGDVTLQTNTSIDTGAASTMDGLLQGLAGTENLTLNSPGANWNFTGTVSQLNTFQVTSAVDVTFDSAVTVATFTQQAGTGTTTLAALTADSISITASDLVLNGVVEASTGSLDITVDALEVDGTVTANAGINLQTATASQTIELGGAVDAGTNFTLTETELQFLASTGVVTIGSASYTGDMSLAALDISGEAYNLKLEGAAGSTVSVDGTLQLGGNNFTIDPPSDVTVNSAITATGSGSVSIEAINEILFQNSGSITTDAGAITLTSDSLITFAQTNAAVLTTSGGAIAVTSDADNNASGATRINANSTLSTGAGAGNITLTGDVTSGTPDTYSLTLTAGAGNVAVADEVGELSQLQVTSAASVDLQDAVDGVGTVDITSSGSVDFDAAVSDVTTLAVDTAGNLNFRDTVSQVTSLAANADGVTRFGGDLSNIGTLTTDAAGTTVISTAAIGVTDATFNDAVTLEENLIITATGDVTFGDQVIGFAGDADTESLTVNAGGVSRFDGDVSNIEDLVTDAAGTTVINTSAIGATDATFNDAVTLEQSLILTAGNDVTFNAAVSGDAGTETLTVNAGNDLTFGSTVDDLATLTANVTGVTRFDGDLSNIGTLTTDANGTTVINTSAIGVTDATFNDAVTFEQSLVVTAGNDVTFDAAVAGDAGTEMLTVNAGNDLTFGSTVDALASLAANVTGVTRFDGDLSNIGTLTTDANGTTVINTSAIGVADATFNDSVTLEQSLVVTAGNDVTFDAAVAGDAGTEMLTVNAGNDLTFGSTVDDLASLAANVTGVTRFDGDLSNIGTLTTDANGTTVINTSAIGVTDATFNDAVTFEQSLVVTAGNDVTFDAAVAGDAGTETLTVNAGNDLTFGSTVDALASLAANVTGVTRFDGDLSNVGTLTTDANGTTVINTSAIGVTDATFNDAVTLEENLIITATGDVTFGDQVIGFAGDGDTESLTVNAGGVSRFDGDVSNIEDLVTDAAGTTVINTSAIGVTDATFNDAVTLAQSLVLTAGNDVTFGAAVAGDAGTETLTVNAGNDLAFGSTVDDLTTLTTNVTGVTRFDGDLSNVGTLTTDANGTTVISTASIGVTDATFNDAVTLEDDLTLTATGDVSFGDALSGSNGDADTESLSIGTSGAIDVSGAVSQLESLTITSAVDVTFDSAVTVATFTQQAGTGTTTFEALTADSISLTTSDLVLNGVVEASTGTLDITVDTLEVDDTVTANAGINLQTATVSQTIELGGAVDAGTNFTLTETELQFLASTGVVTIGSASYTGDMSLAALDISGEAYDLKLEGAAGSTVSVDGTLLLGGNNFTIDPPSDVTVNSAITATGSGSVSIEAINEILFQNSGSITTDAGAITLTSDNLITFAQTNAAVLTTSGGAIAVTSDADNNASGATRINANSTLSTGAGAGNITLTGDVTSSTPDTYSLTLTAGAGNVAVTNAVGQLNTLQVTSAVDVTFDSAVTVATFTQQAGTGTTTFEALTADSISLTTSDLVLNGGVEASTGSLDVTVDTLEVGNTVTANAGINLQTATAGQTIELGGAVDAGTNFTLTEAELQFLASTGVVTIGSASYTGDMSLAALDISGEAYNLKLEGAAGSTVSVDGTLQLGGNNFTIDPPSDVTVNSAITATGSGSVSIEAINEILFQNSGSITTDAGAITLTSDNLITFAQTNAAVLTTSGGAIAVTSDADNNASGPTRINAHSTLSTGAGAGNITLTGDVTSSTPDTYSLTLTAGAGNVAVADEVGELSQLQVTSAASVDLQDAVDGVGTVDITSSGSVDFDAAVSDVTTLAVDTAGNLNFRDTVSQVTSLVANADGTTRFDGDLSNVGTLTTDAAGSTVINTSAIGVTDVTFNDAVTLEQSLVLTAGNDVTFDAAVAGDAGTETLTVNAGNDLTFGSTVDDLASLAANVTGVTRFDGDLSNIGTLTTDAVGSTVINTSAIGVTDATFNEAVTLEQSLILTAGNDVTFDAAVAGDAGTETLTVNAGNDLTFGSTVDDLATLTANVAGVTRFDGDLGNIGTLTTDAAGSTVIDTSAIGVADATFNDALTLEQNLVLTAGNDVTFDAAVAGDAGTEALTVNAGNDLAFGSTVDDLTTLTANVTGVTRFDGDLSNIGTLTTDAVGSTVINTSAIGVTDATFNEAVTLEQSLILTAGNDVTFDAAVAGDAGTETLTVNAGNDLTFGSTVDDLATLTANVAGVTRFDGDLGNIGTLTTDAAGSTVIDTSAIGVTSAVFNDEVQLEQDLALTAVGDVTFGSTLSGVAGTESLTVVSVDSLVFAGAVSQLQDVTIQDAASVTFGDTVVLSGVLQQVSGSGDTIIDGAVTAAGIDIKSDSIEVRADVTATGGQVEVQASDELIIDATIDSRTAGAAGAITLFAGTLIEVTATGEVLAEAAVDLTSDDGLGNGEIRMADGSQLVSEASQVSMTAHGNVEVSRVESGATADDAIQVVSTAGAILDGGDAARDLITPGGVVLQATAGIGAADGLETNVTRIDASNGPVGEVRLSDLDSVQILQVQQGGSDLVSVTAEGGTLQVSGGSGISTAGGDVVLDAAAGNIDIATEVQTAGGSVQFTAVTGIETRDAGTIDTAGGTGGDGGDVLMTVVGTGDLNLGTSVNSSGGANGAGAGGSGGSVTLIANDGDVIVADVTADGGAGSTDGGAAGNINVTADNDIDLQGSLQSLGGNGATAGPDGLVTLEAGNSILDGNDGATVIRAGRFHATARLQIGEIDQFDVPSGNAIDLELTGSLAKAEVTQAGGEIHLHQAGDLVVESGGLIVGGGVAADAAVSATGDLDLGTNVGAVELSDGDRLNLQAGDVLSLPDAGLDTGTGELRLGGVTDVVDAAGRDLGTLVATDLFFNSGGAGGDTVLNTKVDRLHAEITTDGAGLRVVEADGVELVDVQTHNGDVIVEAAQAAAGDITVDRVRAGSAGVVFDNSANGGAIVDGDETFTDVEAESLAIRTTAGVAGGDRLEVDVDRVAVTTVQGDIELLDVADGLQVTTVSGVAGLQITGGGVSDHVDVRAVSSLEVVSDVVNTGGGNVLLAALTTGADGDLTVLADVSTMGGSGSVGLVAAGDLLVNNGAVVSASQLGTVLVSAGENRPVDAVAANGAADANLTLADGTQITSEAGDIALRAPGDVLISTVTADGDNNAVKGDVSVLADFDGVSGGLSDGSGAVVDNSTQAAANVNAADLQIEAATGVGAADPLETTVDTLSIVNSTSGDVRILEQADGGSNSLTVNGVANQLGDVVLQTADGDLSVVGTVSTTGGGEVQMTAGDSLNNGGGNLQVSASVTSEAGSISLDSEAADVELAGNGEARSSGAGDVEVTAANGAISMADGTELATVTGKISLTALSQVTVGRIVTQSAADDAVQIQTSDAIVDAGDSGGADIEAENGRAVLSAENGVGSGNALETAIDRVLLTNGKAGNVEIDEETDLQIDGLTQDAPGDVKVTTAGTINVIAGAAGISLQGGNLELIANGVTSSVILGSDVATNGGDMLITADDSVELGTGVQLDSQNGQIEIVADDDAGRTGTSGSLTMDATAGISSGTGRIELSADGNATLTNVVTSTDLVVTSFNGGIVDAGDVANFDLIADRAALQAASGIGAGNALETQFSTLAISNDGSGDIEILNDSVGPLKVGSFNGLSGVQQSGNDGGSVSIANTGSLLVNESVLNAAGGTISLTAESGLGTSDLTVNAAIAASGPNGHLTLNAERELTLNDTGAFIDILATSITGDAGDDLFIAEDVIIQSSTGAVIQSIPLLENIVTPQVLATGDASVSGDFGRLNELNFAITVDWADGTVETFQRMEATPSSFVFEHQYFGNPNPGDPAAPIPISVSIADDPNITFLVNGVEQTLGPITSFADVPGEGLAGGIAFDLSVDVPELGSSAAVSIEAVNNRNDSSVQDQEESDSATVTDEATISEERIVKLRIFNAAGEVTQELILTGDQALRLLNDFVGFVEERGLPAGRYQILQQEPGDQTMRVVYDLEWREGNSEGLQDRPPTADDNAAMPMPAGEGQSGERQNGEEESGDSTDEPVKAEGGEAAEAAPRIRTEEE